MPSGGHARAKKFEDQLERIRFTITILSTADRAKAIKAVMDRYNLKYTAARDWVKRAQNLAAKDRNGINNLEAYKTYIINNLTKINEDPDTSITDRLKAIKQLTQVVGANAALNLNVFSKQPQLSPEDFNDNSPPASEEANPGEVQGPQTPPPGPGLLPPINIP